MSIQPQPPRVGGHHHRATVVSGDPSSLFCWESSWVKKSTSLPENRQARITFGNFEVSPLPRVERERHGIEKSIDGGRPMLHTKVQQALDRVRSHFYVTSLLLRDTRRKC